MDPFNNATEDSYDQNYLYQDSNSQQACPNFLYEDSCVFLHNYQNEDSCQEKLLPKTVQDHEDSHQSSDQASYDHSYDETVTQREDEERTAKCQAKHKAIRKPSKCKTQKLKVQKLPKIKVEQPKKSGNKSKFNNFGGFLIGSLAESLNKARNFKISNGTYEILEDSGQFVPIFKSRYQIGDQFGQQIVGIIRKMKRQVNQLPRKQGAKKDLSKIVNDHPKDDEVRKECKRMIRQEMIFQLGQAKWLNDHVNSREFSPKDDDAEGTKKKERREAYTMYLQAIRSALIEKDGMPLRLAL